MPNPTHIAIEDLPLLDDESALFDATSMQGVATAVIISLITNP